MDRGADRNVIVEGQMLLHITATNGPPDLVRSPLGYGLDLHTRDDFRFAALLPAVWNSLLETAE